MKRRRRAAAPALGALSAIPLLFALMAMGGVFFATSLAAVVTEREAAASVAEDLKGAEDAITALQAQYDALVTRIAELEEQLRKAQAAHSDQSTLAALREELEQLKAALEKVRTKLGLLQAQKAQLEDRLVELHAQEAEAADLTSSQKDLEEAIATLKAEIDALEQDIKTVSVAVEEKKQVHATDLAPSGSLKPAVFMECDADGLRMMPENILLESTVTPESQSEFLTRAKLTGFVVFLIRPNGFTAFKRYREVLETYNDTADVTLDYGYEPVNSEWPLVYPAITPQGGKT